jgi:phosphatidylglycerol lysyltransferase
VGLIAAFAYSTVGLYFLDVDFRDQASLGLALRDSFRLLFILPSTQAEAVTRHGAVFVDSARVAFLTAFGLGFIQLLRPVVHRARTTPRDRARVEQLLDLYADSSLAFFALLPDKSYFFSASGSAVLAYKVAGNTAVVMSDPLGQDSDFDELVASFQEHCELNGWAFGFSQARPRYLPLYERHGLKTLKIGEEGVVDVVAFNLSGTRMKHLRATVNRFERDGYKVQVLPPPHTIGLIAVLRGVSDAWLAQGNRRERTFTLGHFDEGLLQGCAVMAVADPAGEIVAFANIVPSYRSNEGNFDMVRYPEVPKGLADYLYVSLIRHFRESGRAGMNLGLAPFSGLQDVRRASPAATAMRILYRHANMLLRYKGLRGFKDKFQPIWEPRFLVYSSESQLAGLALAIMRVGELRPRPRSRGPENEPRRRTPIPLPSI